MFTALAYFLFGDGDAQARLPMALAGIGLVASAWMLRPYLGRRGALIAAVLLGFSPSLLYFTRFARHDGLMVLWELWMVIGIFRYIDTGKPGYLYLLAASIALAIGTHELYYIVFFIFGLLMLVRIIAETTWGKYINMVLGGLVGICAAIGILTMVFYVPLPVGEGLYLGEKVFLTMVVLLFAWASSFAWDPTPVVVPRFVHLWRNERTTLWIALSILVGLYLVMYTTFFAYPRGAIDGLYAGLAYWLGSQQEFARGDQPWYYYFLLLGVYEPLGILAAVGAAIYLYTRGFSLPWLRFGRKAEPQPAPETTLDVTADTDEETTTDTRRTRRKRRHTEDSDEHTNGLEMEPEPATASGPRPNYMPLFILIMVAWYFCAIVIFSWAGEKMPWLVIHMALPGNLIAAWVLGRLLRLIPPLGVRPGVSPIENNPASDATPETSKLDDAPPEEFPSTQREGGFSWRVLMVPPLLLLLLIALGVALSRFYSDAGGQEGQSNLLQGFVPLLVFGGCVYALLTLSQYITWRVTLAVSALTLSLLFGAYMLRSTWIAVYQQPDVAVELLVYTQTSPDVPRYVDYVRELAVNQTRNYRSADDVTGGLTMPIILSSSDSSGEGSLAWPMQWYLRDFQRLNWKGGDEIRSPSPTYL
ncbi:MAG: TIGR03663 family protein [Chloroflexaceae bacterium]|nr:TIGR03663 family protein [Chloroflexaceae bacterium]